jgi:general secretion pathway protein D
MKWAAMAVALAMLVGCAGDTIQADAKRMLANGETQAGLALLARAAEENPRDRELRIEWLRQRELAASRLVAQGDTARARNQPDEAAAAYKQALAIDPEHPRAKSGLSGIAADRRHLALVQEADGWFRKQNYAEAETRLRTVLNENPGNQDARNLLRRVNDAKTTQSLLPPVLKSAIGKKVTLEFKDANIRSVFEVIGRTTGVNFVFDKDVRPDLRTTIAVRNTTVEDAIKLILLTSQLERRVLNDNTLLIYPNTPAKQKEYQELVVRSFQVANADVKQMMNLVRTVVKTRDLYIDEKLNLLVMKDTPEAVRLAEKLIETQDMADPEVTLEVEVLEVSNNRLKELGVRFPDRVTFQDPATVGAAAAVMRASGPLVGFVATPAVTLNLRQQDGYANVLANPRIRVKNREKAKIHIGDRVPVITTTSTANVGVSASVNYLDVGLKLEVEPTIHLEGDVGIKVGLEVSNIVREVPTTGGGLAYQVGTRNAATVLRLRDGETQVLAGLIQDEERSTANRVPGVGDLPVLGRLFSSNLDTRGKTEIVLLITPRVVRNLARGDNVMAEFHSGTETAIGAAPLVLGPTDPGSVSASGTPSAGAAPGGPAPFGGDRPAPSSAALLQLSAPPRAAPGSEMTVTVALLPHMTAATASMDLVYDPALLAPVAADAANANGRVPVQLARSGGFARADVKFRVVAKAPGRTQVAVENVVARDSAQSSVPVTVPAPASVDLAP